jgi:phosphogluconate dehydratase
VRVCARDGFLGAIGVDLASRDPAAAPPAPVGTGRELFALMRHGVDDAERGASAMLAAMEQVA